jgi:hypothetical protein
MTSGGVVRVYRQLALCERCWAQFLRDKNFWTCQTKRKDGPGVPVSFGAFGQRSYPARRRKGLPMEFESKVD